MTTRSTSPMADRQGNGGCLGNVAALLAQMTTRRREMPKFLIKGKYSANAMKGLQKEKAASRQKVVEAACAAVGGKLDALYFALGDDDLFLIVDLPSHVHAASLCVTFGASGVGSTSTVPLLTVAEMDQALGETINYRAPGA